MDSCHLVHSLVHLWLSRARQKGFRNCSPHRLAAALPPFLPSGPSIREVRASPCGAVCSTLGAGTEAPNLSTPEQRQGDYKWKPALFPRREHVFKKQLRKNILNVPSRHHLVGKKSESTGVSETASLRKVACRWSQNVGKLITIVSLWARSIGDNCALATVLGTEEH